MAERTVVSAMALARWLARWLALAVFASSLRASAAFNVLPQGAIVFSAPLHRISKGDYFGYSVMLAAIEGNTWMVVAAPRANSSFEPQYTQSGSLYRCPPVGGNCEEMKLLQGETESHDEPPLHINDGNLGGAMDALLGNNGMVVCNPLFKQQYVEDTLDMPGICYLLTKYQFKLKNTVLPGEECLINNQYWNDQHGTPQMGFSIHQLKEEGQHFLVGGPGFFNGRGTVALYLYNIDTGQQEQKYGVAISSMQNSSYFGYSVTSGNFSTDGELYVGGAPRAQDLHGKVIIFSYKRNQTCLNSRIISVVIEKELNGEQVGEYFGASLAVADVNGDGIDELFVGAPLHSSNLGDEGKVYMFMSSQKNDSKILDIKEEIVSKVKISGARFGTSIASLGDIDKDGYSDVVIGAPYANSEKGAIYIYYGSSESPFLKYEQLIRASDINDNLRGFGFSFSRNADVDNNAYNDWAVGSYLSGNAVMFRTSPVIRFNSTVRLNYDKIPMNDDILDLFVCIMPNELLEDTGVEITLNIDPIYSRGHVKDIKKIKYNLTMTKGNLKDACQKFPLTMKKNTVIFKPFEIELSYNIIYPVMKNGDFCKTCPILDIKNPITRHYLHYQTGCAGQVCKTDLSVKGNFNDVPSNFVIGTNNRSSIEMIVEVSNFLEASHETNVTITFPSAIKLRQLDQSCYKLKTNFIDLSTLICEVPYMINQTSKPFSFYIHFDMDSVPWHMNLLQVDISVQGSGEEQNFANDKVMLLQQLEHIANVSIKGRSNVDYIPFANKLNGSEEYEFRDVSFDHSYTILNNGPSPVHGLSLKFMFPYKIRRSGEDIIYLLVQPAFTRFLQPVFSIEDEKYGDEVVDSQRKRYPQYLNLDCSFPEVECQQVYYNTSNTLHANQGITITFKIQSPLGKLGPLIKESGIYIRTSGEIKDINILKQELEGKTYFYAEAEIKLSGRVVSQANVQEWIIIVAIIGGIIILAIMCIILWKLGFFKRNKPPSSKESEEVGDEESIKPETEEKVETDEDRLCNA